jgi:hypothetical protein
MTPEQKLKHLILLKQQEFNADFLKDVPVTEDNIDELFDENNEDYELQDATQEMRCTGIDTDLECEWSRHYESNAVAIQYIDGSWVGWTYWFGGGRHGEPEAIDWMDSAYDVQCSEEEKIVVVRTFTKEST